MLSTITLIKSALSAFRGLVSIFLQLLLPGGVFFNVIFLLTTSPELL